MFRRPASRAAYPRRALAPLCAAVVMLSLLGSGATAPRAAIAAGTAATIDAVNLRSGPSVDDAVIDVMPGGSTVTITGDPENGYYPVSYNGEAGWAFGAFLDTGSSAAAGYSAVTTTVLNLRAGPSLDNAILAVMPAGAVVTLTGDGANGFLAISYAGTDGWADGLYLNGPVPGSAPADTSGDTNANTPPTTDDGTTPPAATGNSTDDIIAIIYAAADRYGQPRADMLRVAECESNLTPTAVNPSSGASGLFQFMPSTWATTPYANDDIFDAWASANAAGWMWSVGRRGEWACQ